MQDDENQKQLYTAKMIQPNGSNNQYTYSLEEEGVVFL